MTSTTRTIEQYNGHANYPTWAVDLWLSNDEGLYRAALEMVGQAIADAPTDPNTISEIWTVNETAKFRLADALKDWIREMVELDEASMRSDLLRFALDFVDYEEIAVSWIGAYSEQYER